MQPFFVYIRFDMPGPIQNTAKNKTHGTLSVEIYGLKTPEPPRESTIVDRQVRDFRKFGNDNLFPQAMAELNRSAPNQRGILFWKTIYTLGNGFTFDEGNSDLELLVNEANNEGESLIQVYKKIVRDHFGAGNEYIEFVTNSTRDFLNIFHRDYTTARKTVDGSAVIFHPAWNKYRSNKKFGVEIPLWPNFVERDGNLHTILHLAEYEPEFKFYGLPSWIAGFNAAAIAHKTDKWNVSRLDNSFQVSGILEIYGDEGDKKLKAGVKNIKKSFTGEGRNSNLITIVRQQGSGEATKFTPMVQNSEGEFVKLHEQSDQTMLIAHNWFPSLSGIQVAGKLGDAQSIRNQYQIAKNTVIREAQTATLEPIKKVIQEIMGFDTSSLSIVNEAPISLIDEINVNQVMKLRQAIELIGGNLDDYTEDELEQFIDQQKNGTVNITGQST